MVLARAALALWSLLNPMTNFMCAKEALSSIWQNRALTIEWARREMGGQYAGQALGSLWIIGHPLLMLGIYVFVFSVVLKIRISTSVDMPQDYTTYLLAGLIPWLSILQALTRAPQAFLGHANIVKQVVFPLEVLPAAAVMISAIPLAVGIVLLVGRSVLMTGTVSSTMILLPVAIIIHMTFILGIAFLLASVTPFFKDIKDIVVVLSIAGVYIIPAFYLPEWVPAVLRPLLYINPFSYFVWMYQDILYYGAIRHEFAWFTALALAFFSLAMGYRAFRGLRQFVANVL